MLLAFSIPERIVLVETCCLSSSASVARTFSIPERIVLVETWLSRFPQVLFANFQYPRTDRIG